MLIHLEVQFDPVVLWFCDLVIVATVIQPFSAGSSRIQRPPSDGTVCWSALIKSMLQTKFPGIGGNIIRVHLRTRTVYVATRSSLYAWRFEGDVSQSVVPRTAYKYLARADKTYFGIVPQVLP